MQQADVFLEVPAALLAVVVDTFYQLVFNHCSQHIINVVRSQEMLVEPFKCHLAIKSFHDWFDVRPAGTMLASDFHHDMLDLFAVNHINHYIKDLRVIGSKNIMLGSERMPAEESSCIRQESYVLNITS